jgi:phosphatidylglycerophosphatase A
VTRVIATFGFIGLIPVAAGTFASLAALATGYLLHRLGGFPLFVVAAVIAYALGTWAARAERDRSRIVVDEVVGQWIALMPLSAGLWFAGAPPQLFPWPGWVSAFLLFRLLDIWKPGPVGWADRRPGPTGVMLGDAVAGLIAAALVTLLAALAHGWLA